MKLSLGSSGFFIDTTWNDKNLDYEIETAHNRLCFRQQVSTWNDKNLDYEIETKRVQALSMGNTEAWNDKNLDYEIETWHNCGWEKRQVDYETRRTLNGDTRMIFLETTRTSITRLKRRGYVRSPCRRVAWNDKNLDYEIETLSASVASTVPITWNDKNLDYEIETCFAVK